MTLETVQIEVPTDRFPSNGRGGEAKVPVEAKLLPSVPSVQSMPGNDLIVSVSEEVATELEVGDVIAVPPARGELQPCEVIGEPESGLDGQGGGLWVRVKPARDKRTISHELADAHARDAELKDRMRQAENRKTDEAIEKTERGRELLREAGFHNLAGSISWMDGADGCLRADVDAMTADDELEPAA